MQAALLLRAWHSHAHVFLGGKHVRELVVNWEVEHTVHGRPAIRALLKVLWHHPTRQATPGKQHQNQHNTWAQSRALHGSPGECRLPARQLSKLMHALLDLPAAFRPHRLCPPHLVLPCSTSPRLNTSTALVKSVQKSCTAAPGDVCRHTMCANFCPCCSTLPPACPSKQTMLPDLSPPHSAPQHAASKPSRHVSTQPPLGRSRHSPSPHA